MAQENAKGSKRGGGVVENIKRTDAILSIAQELNMMYNFCRQFDTKSLSCIDH